MGAGRYHHGELRAALVAAALDLLEREGPGALSLRGLAKAVGVSPMAPYHHFADRAELLAAVAAAGFARLQDAKMASVSRERGSPRDALVAGTIGYVAFTLRHPHLYRLMKGPEFADRDRYPELQRAAAAPAASLLALIEDLTGNNPAGGGGADPARSRRRAQQLWGLAHGIGTLALDGQIAPHEAIGLAEEGAAAMIDGWRA